LLVGERNALVALGTSSMRLALTEGSALSQRPREAALSLIAETA
jgi:hypothetical protein